MSCRRSAPTAQPGGLIATSLRADVTVSAAAAAAGDRRTRALASACPRQPRPDLAVSHAGHFAPERGDLALTRPLGTCNGEHLLFAYSVTRM